jgi:hypothetical protein
LIQFGISKVQKLTFIVAYYFTLIFMKNELMIAGIQSHLMWENPAENRNYFEEKINSLSDEIDIVVLPEMFTSGFTMNAKKVAEKMDGATISWMQKLASKNNLAIVGSLVIEEENHFYRAAMEDLYPQRILRTLREDGDYKRTLIQFTRTPNPSPLTEELLVKDASNRYSDGYIELTKDFYAKDLKQPQS